MSALIRSPPPFTIAVLITAKDLHGVPGSQNGFDNSGQRGSILWNTEQSYIDRTNAIIKTLAAEFSQSQYANTVSAIGECKAWQLAENG